MTVRHGPCSAWLSPSRAMDELASDLGRHAQGTRDKELEIADAEADDRPFRAAHAREAVLKERGDQGA